MKFMDWACVGFAVCVFHDLLSMFYRDAMRPLANRLADLVRKAIEKYDIE